MKQHKPNIALKILKIIGWTALGLLILVGMLRLLIYTGTFNNFIKEKVISTANESINGKLNIETLEGDLWKGLVLTEVTIVDEDTLLQADTLRAEYQILSLLGDAFTINQLYLSGINANVKEEEKGEFNLQNLIKTDTTAQADSSGGTFKFDVQQFRLRDSRISVRAPSILPDSSLIVQQLSTDAAFGMADEFYLNLESLSFQLKEGRLPGPIIFSASADFENQTITLNDLVIETGRSVLNAGATFSLRDSSVTAQAQTKPLSLDDVQAYLSEELPEDKLQFSLELSGSLSDLEIRLNAEGSGFDSFLLTANLNAGEIPELNKMGISVRNIDLSYFDPNLDAQIDEFQATLNGKITTEYENANVTWGFTFLNLRYEDYFIDRFFGSGTLQDERVISNLDLVRGKSEIILHPKIDHIFSDQPSWNILTRVHYLDPAYLAQNSNLEGSVSLLIYASGDGFQLTDENWEFEIKHLSEISRTFIRKNVINTSLYIPDKFKYSTDFNIAGQTFSDFNISGSINKDSLSVNGFVQLFENEINFDARIDDFLANESPFNYQLQSDRFDISEVAGMDSLSAVFNIFTEGKGTLSALSQPSANGIIKIDSGFVNGAALNLFEFQYQLEDGMILVPDGKIESEIADGNFSAVKESGMGISPQDRLDLTLQIKNLQPLANFFNAEIVQAQGTVEGILQTDADQIPQFDGVLSLKDIRIDDLFIADEISGMAALLFDSLYSYNLNLDISAPTISAVTLRDLKLITGGIAMEDSLAGNLNIQIESKDAGDITQNLDYAINLSELAASLSWNQLDFQTPNRLLTLQEPFNVHYENQRLQTDTLRLHSNTAAYLNLAIPAADSINRQIWVEGRNFDFGVIQEIVTGERIVDGVLSGEMEVLHQRDTLDASGSLQIRRLNYKEAKVDSLNFTFNISDKRLNANGNLHFEGEEKVAGNLNVPFLIGDPTTFDEAFFREEVNGELSIAPVDLDRFEKLLSEYGITETKGILSFDGDLSGTAGEPIFHGRLNFEDPTLSGIPVESAFAEFRYDHIEGIVTTNAEILAQGQKAASISSDLPISFNFQTFEFNTPDETDTILVELKTEEFNLSVFNDFLNRENLADLQGILNADVQISGTVGNMQPKGTLLLERAALNVPVANIKLNRIRAELEFTSNGLMLQQFHMRSGGGRFNANGLIKMDGIDPVEMDLQANARQFKLINTDEYNLTIDLESQLKGTPTKPEASGRLTILNGFVYLQDFGERSVETVQLEGEKESTFNLYDSLSLDMNLIIARNFFVRNERYLDMEIEMTGNLEAQKEPEEDLQLFGSLSANDGYARPLGKHFEMEEGEFLFSGPLNDPALNMRTSYIPQTSQKEGEPIILYYIIEGTAQDPVFRFESDPQMAQQDIIAYTLFGRPFYALDSWQQVISGEGTGSSPTDLLVNVLLDEVEALATRELGIDVVQIDNTRSGSEAVTSVKTGWYLNRRTFFSIINEISTDPKTLFILEYMLTEDLDLILTQGDDNRQGIDLRWEIEY